MCADECDVLEDHGCGREKTPTVDDYLSDIHSMIENRLENRL